MAGTTKEFDPIEYIENSFVDRKKSGRSTNGEATKFRKTQLSAPRPRRAKVVPGDSVLDHDLKNLLETLPKNIEYLGRFFNDTVTSRYYQGEFKETREMLIRRLLDPELTLEEVSRLLGVCPATVRRYTNRGWLTHHRTTGGQRRFRLSGLAAFIEQHGRLPEA
ncbi:MAG: helix-turn-helix domain-containing protein [Armatimonadota bacterium]